MNCPVCGSPVTEGARFCAACGHALRPPSEERRVVTVLFADLVGFTTLAETRDPEQVKNLVDRCFEELVAVIGAYGGRVDKIIGDAIVALFGAPVAHEDDAERAVRAALAMQQALDDWAGQEAAAQLRLRVGVNTGEVLTGAMRAGGEYTAMGDTVNTASRLQTMASPGQVVVGSATFQATRRVVRYTPLGAMKAKGREEPVEAWVADEAIGLPGARSSHDGPLVGRDAELDVLRGAVAAAVSRGRSHLVLVMAEAGMGKTRLAEAVACEAARTYDATVLDGRCVPYGEANVWWPVAEAVRNGCGIAAGAPRRDAAALAGAVVRDSLGATDEAQLVTDGLLHLMGYETPLQGIDPARAREDLVRSLLAFVDAAAARRPVIVVLSDLHWADDAVLALGDALLERVAAKPFVLIATARPTLFDRWQPRPGRHNLVVLNLDPLSRQAAGSLLDTLVGDTPLAPDLREVLLDRSGGNPFFLEELVSLVTETQQSGELPHTLRGLVAARIDALPVVERRMLEDAAVLGRRGTVEALQIMAAKAHGVSDEAAIDGAVAGLVAKDVVVVESGVWSFKSDLVREVAYGVLTKADRARRHAGVAYWLSTHEPDRPESVDRMAHHFATAAALVRDLGRVDHLDGPELIQRALAALVLAIENAEGGELHVVARKLSTQALELLRDDDHARVRFLVSRARAATQLREMAAARTDLDAAMIEAERVADQQSVARVLLGLGDLEQKDGELAASTRLLQQAVDTFRSLGDACGEADALRSLGLTRMFGDDHAAAASAFSEALDLYRSAGDRRGEAWALQNLAWLAFSFGDVETAEQWINSSADTFREIGDRGGLGWAHGLLAYVRYQQGRFAEAEALGEKMLVEARERADVWAVGMMLVLVASIRLWTGRAAQAVEPGREAHKLFGEMHDWYGLAQAVGVLGRSLVASGRVDDGFAVLHDALAAARSGPTAADRRLTGLYLISLISAAVQVGDPDRVAGAAMEASADGLAWDEQHVSLWLLAAQRGDVAAAATALDAVTARTPNSAYGASALAVARAATGDGDGALVAAENAIALPGATYSDKAHAMVARALVHAAAGDRDAATAAVDEAVALVGATEDVVLQAIVGAARARVAERAGDGDVSKLRARAEADFSALGITQRGWDTLHEKALDPETCAARELAALRRTHAGGPP